MESHDLTVSSDLCAAPVAQNATETIPILIARFMEEAKGFAFNYAGHGELPLREDSCEFICEELIDPKQDYLWVGLVLEATGLRPDGTPFFQFKSPATGRRIQIHVPCWATITWVQRMPENISGVISHARANEESTVIGYTQFDGTDEYVADAWLKVARVTQWCRSALVVSL